MIICILHSFECQMVSSGEGHQHLARVAQWVLVMGWCVKLGNKKCVFHLTSFLK